MENFEQQEFVDSGTQTLKVGDWLVEPKLSRISRDSDYVDLRPQVMDLLVYLAGKGGQVVSADTLIDDVWKDVIVSSGSVYNCINELRHAFGDDPHNPAYLETISKRGYRLIAPVEFAGDAPHRRANDRDKVGGDQAWFGIGHRKQIISGLFIMVFMVIIYQLMSSPDTPPAASLTVSSGSIAVLPFRDLSPEGDQEYFSDGISEEILNVLAQIKDLNVTSRSSSFSFKGQNIDMPTIAARLGVSNILEGSVRKSGNRIRITAQLIEVATDKHLWSETYDRDLSDIFAVQDEISKAIVDALKTTLNIDVANVNFAQGTSNTEAYEQYLLGLYHYAFFTLEEINQAKVYIEKAIDLDPNYAEAWAKLVRIHMVLSDVANSIGTTPYAISLEQMGIAAAKAMALNPELAEVQVAQGSYLAFQNDYVYALIHYKRAIELNPNHADSYFRAGRASGRLRQYEQALNYFETAEKIDPMNLLIKNNLTADYAFRNQFEKANDVVRRMEAIDKDASLTEATQSYLLLSQGHYTQVISKYREMLRQGKKPSSDSRFLPAMAAIGLHDDIKKAPINEKNKIIAYYLDQDYDQFIKLARNNYAINTLNIQNLDRRALAEMLAGNYQLSAELYQSFDACTTSLYNMACKNLYYAKRMLGDTEMASQYLEKIKIDENKAIKEGWRIDYMYPHEISQAYTLVVEGKIDDALALYKAQLENGYFDYNIMAPHFKELHDHPDWPAFLSDIKVFQAVQQAKLAELEAEE